MDVDDHRPLRRSARTDLTERDHAYLIEIARHEGWTLNKLLRHIANKWVTAHIAGHDWGVLPPPLDESPPKTA